MRWRLILEEFGPELRYMKGTNNIVADALSRLDMNENLTSTVEDNAESFCLEEDEFPADYPLTYAQIHAEQEGDDELQQRYLQRPMYDKKTYQQGEVSYDLIIRENKIVLPSTLQTPAVECAVC